MKPQPEGHALENPYHKEDIKPDAFLVNKARSPSQYQDGDNMSYSEKEALKQLPEAPNWPNSLEQENMIIWNSLIILMDPLLMYQTYHTTGLLLDSIQHSKDMLVFDTQRWKKSIPEGTGHGVRVK
ncbi:hypothetical protein O181_062883 [Austropuccinia psidii MF-1]|uniref:Uncharacterized protein n=1 Tax=Austropuccinia psidii MF-1 TaxID=1389203 RepID=A0A9Q3EQJ9_9BASI|nr:hypothetical protein [Austropuccinia psidii MF-1]